nr:MAG TPA: hypothetical protein [Caudoviricetes sp.]
MLSFLINQDKILTHSELLSDFFTREFCRCFAGKSPSIIVKSSSIIK